MLHEQYHLTWVKKRRKWRVVKYKIALLPLLSETLKNTYQKVHFFGKVEATSLQLY